MALYAISCCLWVQEGKRNNTDISLADIMKTWKSLKLNQHDQSLCPYHFGWCCFGYIGDITLRERNPPQLSRLRESWSIGNQTLSRHEIALFKPATVYFCIERCPTRKLIFHAVIIRRVDLHRTIVLLISFCWIENFISNKKKKSKLFVSQCIYLFSRLLNWQQHLSWTGHFLVKLKEKAYWMRTKRLIFWRSHRLRRQLNLFPLIIINNALIYNRVLLHAFTVRMQGSSEWMNCSIKLHAL